MKLKKFLKEDIKMVTLDSIFYKYVKPDERVLLKIDAQGYEREILMGAEASLPQISAIQLEMSLVHLYEGELLCHEVILLMKEKGFTLVDIERGFVDKKTGNLLQMDGFFVNDNY